MEALKIILGCIFAAMLYGVLHDQVTARVCVEYFTLAHPPVFGTDSPTLLGLGWGVRATWLLGLLLGSLLAMMARVGAMPKLAARDLLRPVALAMLSSAACALLSGLTAWMLARQGIIAPSVRWLVVIPPSKHAAFLADAWAHNASYGCGLVGGLFVAAWTWRRRVEAWHESRRP